MAALGHQARNRAAVNAMSFEGVNARDRFKVNDRVVASATNPIKSSTPTWPARGTVRGFAKDPEYVRVQRDGMLRVERWLHDHWNLEPGHELEAGVDG